MSHLDDDLIAAAAIGERLDEGNALHLDGCAACAQHVRDLQAIAARAAAAGHPAPLLVPPAHVWDAIEAQIAQDSPAEADVVFGISPHREPGTTRAPRGRAAPRRSFSGRVLAAVAAVGVVIGGVGVGVGVWAAGAGDDATVVAEAPLTDLATQAPAGIARVESRQDGTQVLVLDTDYVASPEGDLEVWLIDPDIEGMVSLGFLVSSHGEFAIPSGYDPAEYPIVDISLEPRDGVPTHHGDSITRGVLDL